MDLILNEYAIWITSLTSLYAKDIFNELLTRGYTVSSLSGEDTSPVLDSTDTLSSVIAIKLSSDKKLVVAELYDIIANLLLDLKVKYHSIIISEFVNCIWSGSNIIKIVNKPEVKNKILN